MNIIHSKTVKFITQLRHMTQGRTKQHKQKRSIQISDNQMFEVMAKIRIIVAETHVYVKASSATMQRGARQRDLWRTHVKCPSN